MTEVRYTLTVYITQAIEDTEHPDAWTNRDTCRWLERQVIKALSKLDGDADCEVMQTELIFDGVAHAV